MKSRNELQSDFTTSLKRVKTFSCPEFKDVYSNAYFKSIVKPTFENSENTYSFIFGDFNKLGVINDVYGHEFGDNALRLAMRIIKKSIPKDAIIIRAGGDEIYIILPNSDKNFAEKCSKLIKNNLQKNAVLIGGLSIELSSTDSTYGNIDKLINITDNEVTNIKASREETNSPANILADNFLPLQTPKSLSQNEKNSWNELNDLINISVYEFLQNFRPSKNFEFKPQQIVDSSDFVTNSLTSLLNEKLGNKLPKKLAPFFKNDYEHIPESDNKITDNTINTENTNIGPTDLIHSIINQNTSTLNIDKYSDEELQYITNSLNNLLEQLVRDNTGLLNKQYFRLFLSQEIINSNKDYSATYLSVPGLKLSNFAYGHTFSDNRLDTTNKFLCQEAKNALDFDNSAFDSPDDNVFFISQGGGNYLCLYPKELANIVQPKINSIVNKANSIVNIKDLTSGFYVSSYSLNDTLSIPKNNTSDTIKFIRALKEETNFQKVSLKKKLFKSSDAYFAFKKSMDNCVDYYLKNISNGEKDITKMIQFIRNVYTSFLNQEVLHNETREEKKTIGLYDNDIEK